MRVEARESFGLIQRSIHQLCTAGLPQICPGPVFCGAHGWAPANHLYTLAVDFSCKLTSEKRISARYKSGSHLTEMRARSFSLRSPSMKASHLPTCEGKARPPKF